MCLKISKEYFRQFTTDEIFNKIVDINTINELLDYSFTNFKHLKAVAKFDGSFATYEDLFNDVLKVASYFKINNIFKQNIGVSLANSYEFEVISLGIIASGNTACLLPCTLPQDKINYFKSKLNINLIIDKDNLSILNTDIVKDALANNKKNDSACILLTGGTTGIPKGVVLSHGNLLAGTINGCYGLKDIFNKTYYCLIPLTHSFGFIRNMLTSIYTGSLIYYCQDKREIFTKLPEYKPSVLVIVPNLAELFLNIIKQFGKQALGGNIDTIICGSANVPPYLGKEYSKLGITFCPGYGLTECSNIVTGNPFVEKYPESVGLLFPNQEAKIVNGELYLRGETLFKGYYNDANATSLSMDGGWFKTGDLAKIENNMIYIVGRIKDIIVLSSGEKVSPAYVESKVLAIDAIQDCLVYALKNEFGNEYLVCEVTLRNNILKSLSLDDNNIETYIQKQIDKVNDQLEPFERINKLIIREKDFDRTPAMKIIRKKN